MVEVVSIGGVGDGGGWHWRCHCVVAVAGRWCGGWVAGTNLWAVLHGAAVAVVVGLTGVCGWSGG